MANVFNPVTDQSKVTGKELGSMDTAGSSFGITVKAGRLVDFACNIAAGDSLAVQFEYESGAANIKEWVTVETFTADGTGVYRVASQRRARVTMAGSNGTNTYELTSGNKE
jgi:hypothetical protein